MTIIHQKLNSHENKTLDYTSIVVYLRIFM